MPESASATSKVLLFFDELFDSFNGRQGQGLSSLINLQSNHKRFWQKALFTLYNMQFVEKTTLKPLRRNAPKCLKNWMWTIRGAICLWDILQKNRFIELNLKHINQDVIENFFGQIRDMGHRNINPTPYQFGTAFKTLITVNITSKHSVSSNCEKNEMDSSLGLITMFRAADIAYMENNTNIDCTEAAILTEETNNILVNINKIVDIMHKKWIPLCSNCAKELENKQIINILQQIVNRTEVQFLNFYQYIKLKEHIVNSMATDTNNLTMHCNSASKELLNMIAEEFIQQWCNFVNKILNGKVMDGFQLNYIYNQAKSTAMRHIKKGKKIKFVNKKT